MALNVTITQSFGSNEQVMTVLTNNDEALLKLLANGLAKAGATALQGTLAVQDSDFAGFAVRVQGKGLTYDANGRLSGGTISQILLLDASNAVVGRISTAAPGGLGLDVVAVKNSATSSVINLVPLVDDWKFTFSATGITQGTPFFNAGAYFEGGFLNDSLTGSAFADLLLGARGNDTLRGGAGMDTLDGDDTLTLLGDDGNGRDVMYGEAGADVLRGRGGSDVMYGGADNDVLTGDQIGETGNDAMYGGDGNDVLWGAAGNDTLNGGAGYDRVAQPLPMSGDFVFNINLATGRMTGEGTDRLISIEGAGGASNQRNVLTGNAAANGFTGGNLADTLNGGGGNDRLNGAAGADSVQGGLGNDSITGGTGNDTLRGDGGADHFIFTEAGAADADRIADFTAADQIDIYQALVSFAPAGALAAGAFKLITGTVDADDRVIYDRAKGQVWVDGDGSGAQVAQLLCTVTPGKVLSAADFHILGFADLPNYL